MIRASEAFSLSTIVYANLVAAVRASVDKYTNLAAAVAHDDDRHFTHIVRHVIPWAGNHLFVADDQPRAVEDLAALCAVQLFIKIDACGDPPVPPIDSLVQGLV